MRPTQRLMNTLRNRGCAVYNVESHLEQLGTEWTVKEPCRLLGPDSWLATADYYLSDRWLARAHRRAVTLGRLRLPISGKNSRVLCCRPRAVWPCTGSLRARFETWNRSLKMSIVFTDGLTDFTSTTEVTPLFGPTLTHQTSPLSLPLLCST